ncbi:MAG: hypothetical protein KAI26_02875, partial [Nanoarchaeota archaeon]|nr:hypothetical protein [Nanoarchaeota archaeon]
MVSKGNNKRIIQIPKKIELWRLYKYLELIKETKIKQMEEKKKKMEYIYLVKPGKSFFGLLTPEGVKQMRAVGTDLSYYVARDFYDLREEYESEGSDFVKRVEIFHSPLQPATESAQIIVKYLGYAQIEAKEEAKEELKPSPCYDGDGVQSIAEIIKRPG